MGNVSVVIGANYGDEGKGHLTDYLCTKKSMVVRFNGGAQAGHTVVTPDGRRHVFHHFGSGTFLGAKTFLSRFFLVNPLLFNEEFDVLKMEAPWPLVHVDPMCPITTPFDMILNQAVEKSRGIKRHGSCGMGINETVKRTAHANFSLYYQDLKVELLEKKLEKIRDHYVHQRAAELQVVLDKQDLALINSPGLMEHFLEDVLLLLSRTNERDLPLDKFLSNRSLVFEGAQGLRLDAESPDFPYVTNSRTGLTNVLSLIEEAGMKEEKLDVYYATRPYITRHGAGPLSHEWKHGIHLSIEDKTNVPNLHQGTIRYGWFDIQEFEGPVQMDIESARLKGFHIAPKLAMTCLDQARYYTTWFDSDHPTGGTPEELIEVLAVNTPFTDLVVSDGPTREDVQKTKE